MEIGGKRNDPRLRGQLGQEVALIQLQSFQLLFQPGGRIWRSGGGPDPGIEILRVKGEGNIAVPGVTSTLAQDQRASGGFVDLVQHGANTMEHGLQRVGRVAAPFFVLPEQTDQLILRDGTIAAVDHVGQQKPNFSGTVVAVIQFDSERKPPQHLYVQFGKAICRTPS